MSIIQWKSFVFDGLSMKILTKDWLNFKIKNQLHNLLTGDDCWLIHKLLVIYFWVPLSQNYFCTFCTEVSCSTCRFSALFAVVDASYMPRQVDLFVESRRAFVALKIISPINISFVRMSLHLNNVILQKNK